MIWTWRVVKPFREVQFIPHPQLWPRGPLHPVRSVAKFPMNTHWRLIKLAAETEVTVLEVKLRQLTIMFKKDWKCLLPVYQNQFRDLIQSSMQPQT